MKIELNILMLEDDPLDADLNKLQLLLLEEYNCNVRWVTGRNTFIEALDASMPDIVISDYNLPQYNGLEALNDLKKTHPLIPFIFVTGTIDEETAAGTIKAGAWDYVVKDRLFRLPLAIRGALLLREERTNNAIVEGKNRQLSMAIEQSPVHIVISNTAHQIEYVNPHFTEVTGYTADEVVGKDEAFTLTGEFQDTYTREIIQSSSWKGEVQSVKKDGTLIWEQVSSSPLRNEQGEITSYVSIREDISQRKAMEQELIVARDRAERSDKLKEAFLQNMSHEIRTPLNAIIGFSDLLCSYDEKDLDTVSRYSKIISNSSKQLLSIVSDILTIARIQTGQETLMKRTVDINELFDQLQDLFHPPANDKNIKLVVVKSNGNKPFFTSTDKTKLEQILSNLLNNAIKFTHKGLVELSYHEREDSIEFAVRDTGIGIPPEAQPFIFERFRQADPSISVNYGGTGLGLSISQSFAQMLGGKLDVDSVSGVGSTFSFSIPHQAANIQATTRMPRHTELDTALTILVAEDEINNFYLIEAILAQEKVQLLHANNGQEALALCQQNAAINLVLMDVKMPVMDGVKALAEIRKLRPNLPIIAQTAYALEEEKHSLLLKGFNDYIAKPIRKEELLEKINKAL